MIPARMFEKFCNAVKEPRKFDVDKNLFKRQIFIGSYGV